MSGLGLKNSLRIGLSSLRMKFEFVRHRRAIRGSHGVGPAGCAPAELLQQRRFDGARVQNRFEPPRGELLHLWIGQLDSMPLADLRTYVAHDLLDIHDIAARCLLRRRRLLLRKRASVSAASVLAPAAAMEMTSAAL
jgi:hypothetical protein